MKGFLLKVAARVYYRLRESYAQYTYSHYRQKYNLDSTFRFNGPGIRIQGEGNLSAGSHSYISSYSAVYVEPGQTIKIGKNTRISHNVRLYTSSPISDQDFMVETLQKKFGNIFIGDGVLIGANSFINPGVTIGNNVIVGANSVVTRDLPDCAIAGGVPAKVIRFKNLASESSNPP